jgi:hypothetical protein
MKSLEAFDADIRVCVLRYYSKWPNPASKEINEPEMNSAGS